MIRNVFAAFFLWLVIASGASAQTCGAYPNTLMNGTNADANQVMANFNAILNCVNSLNLTSGATPQGRLTLASGTPVMASSNAGKTVVYYTPYNGNLIPLYNGSTMVATAFSELNQATTDSTKSPAAVAASSVYDIFVWNDGGTIRATRGPAWANSIARGYTLTMTNGVLLNASSITNGPAALRGTYVGTIASNASGTIDYVFGSGAAGGSAASFGVWNAYNRVTTATTVSDTTGSWTYSSATVRPSDGAGTGSGLNNRISFVCGLAEDGISIAFDLRVNTASTSGGFGTAGFGLDSTSSYTFYGLGATTLNTSPFNAPLSVQGTIAPQLGFHFVQALESGDGTTSTTFVGGGSPYQFSGVLRN